MTKLILSLTFAVILGYIGFQAYGAFAAILARQAAILSGV